MHYSSKVQAFKYATLLFLITLGAVVLFAVELLTAVPLVELAKNLEKSSSSSSHAAAEWQRIERSNTIDRILKVLFCISLQMNLIE